MDLEENRIYNHQSLQLRNNGFRIYFLGEGWRLPTPPKYHYYNFLSSAFLIEAMFEYNMFADFLKFFEVVDMDDSFPTSCSM
jgi:hypothetical protein